MEIFLVGGAIRDEMLGLEVKERDWVVVGAEPKDLKALNFRQVGKSFPVYLHPDTKEEYALARTEIKTGPGYKGFKFDFNPNVTLEEDLGRRDLTINAIARNEAGDLIDPYNGVRDINDRILRHVSEAFVEDPVRVLRLARFAAKLEHLGFHLAPETEQLVKNMVLGGELQHLVPERVWKETEGALKAKGPVAFLKILRQTNALGVLFPELNKLYGVPQNEEHHPEVDTGAHMELVMIQAARISSHPEIRFAALMHDLGKGLTPESEWPQHKGHEQSGLPLLKNICEKYKVPTAYRELAEITMQHHGTCHSIERKTPEDVLNLIEACDGFRRADRFRNMLIACEADSKGRLGFEHTDYEPRGLIEEAFYAADFINAKEVLKDKNIQADEIKQALHDARVKAIADVIERRKIRKQKQTSTDLE